MVVKQCNWYFYLLHKTDADATRPSIELLIDHIDYIVKLIGIDHVGLGADFDGAGIISFRNIDGMQQTSKK